MLVCQLAAPLTFHRLAEPSPRQMRFRAVVTMLELGVALASGEKEFDAKVIGTDPPTDVAVLKVEDGKTLPAITIADSDKDVAISVYSRSRRCPDTTLSRRRNLVGEQWASPIRT